MNQEERSTWVSAIVTPIAFIVYAIIILGRADGSSLAQVSYVSPMLWTVGASIVAMIAGNIVAAILAAIGTAITSPDDVDKLDRTDERDKAISKHGEYIGFYVLSVGVVGALALAMLEADHFWIANAICLAFALSSTVASVVKIAAYRRGF
ncbi:MAG: hypothetical protein ACOCVW_03815 [bacterium]